MIKRSTALQVLLGTLLLLGAGIFLPPLLSERKPPTDLPWQVTVTPQGGVQVFGLTVGESTLADAERRFGESEVTLFRSPQGAIQVEAYFDTVNLSGLDSRIVLGLEVPAAELGSMYERGVQSAKLGSGTLKVTLASADRRRVDGTTIGTLTYMPIIHLKPELVAKRFGEPAEKWKEAKTGVTHWLYPAIGLDIAFSESEKEVLQYVRPSDFERLRAPLAGGERLP